MPNQFPKSIIKRLGYIRKGYRQYYQFFSIFRGWIHKAIHVQKLVNEKFPNTEDILNRLGHLYFTNENQQQYVKVFTDVLNKFPGEISTIIS